MDFFGKYKSPFGYYNNANQIDSYGVNHSGFTTRDELEYQFARQQRENELMNQYKSQGMTENFPQYDVNFWGNSANNYGFGLSNIAGNIGNMKHPLNQGVQYAQNTLFDGANNVNQKLNTNPNLNPNSISDEELYKKMWTNIKEYEKVIDYPYLDTKGYITVGGGANVDNLSDFMNVNFMVNECSATEAQKLAAYNRLRELSNQKDLNGAYLHKNKLADFFEDQTNLRLSDQDAYNIAYKHMKNDLAYLRSQFADFDSLPNPLKEVLLDIQYNVIGGLTQRKWPNLYDAIARRDVDGIARNVNRRDVGQGRNDWAERMVRSIRF